MPKYREKPTQSPADPFWESGPGDLFSGFNIQDLTRQLEQAKKTMQEVTDTGQIIQNMIPDLSRSLLDMGTGAKNARQAFSGFVRSVLTDMNRIMVRQTEKSIQGAFSPLVGSLLSTAFSSLGKSRVTPMANGGVLDRPTLAMIAERPGSKEAVVPLPDGRSIPVREVGTKKSDGKRPLSIINVVDPRMIQSVVARYLSENHEVVLNMINESARTQGISNPGYY